MDDFNGKVAVVTGGGSGIGAAVARACSDEGMAVAVVDRNRAGAMEVANGLQESGATATAFEVDVSDAEQVEAMAAEVYATFGACHLLHNNAGVFMVGRSWEHSPDEWHRAMCVNTLGVVHGVNAFVPRMREQGGDAHIVNTASADALRCGTSTALYKATKFAVLGFTETLRTELAPYGIGVSALCPAGVDTNLFETMFASVGPGRTEEQLGDLLADLGSMDAAHCTMVTPDQVAAVVLEGVRNNEPYLITHPGSEPAVRERNGRIEAAYRTQRLRHPELP